MSKESDDKLNEYKQRQKEWRNISITQLSNTNNIFLTLATGLLLVVMEKNENHLFSILCLCISVFLGIAVLYTRLNDFRISRHLALCRQRLYDNQKKYLPKKRDEKFNFCHRIKVLFSDVKFIKQERFELKDDINFKITRNQFIELSRISDILGTATWKWLKLQIFFFLIGAILYIIKSYI